MFTESSAIGMTGVSSIVAGKTGCSKLLILMLFYVIKVH